jgi:hypothetical protein
MRCLIIGTAVVAVLTLYCSNTYAQCLKDTDCKGDRICEQGKCVSPKQKPGEPKAKQPAPTAPAASLQPAPAASPRPAPAPEARPEPTPEPTPQPEPEPAPPPVRPAQPPQQGLDPAVAQAIAANPALAETLLLKENARTAGAPVDRAKGGIVTGLVIDMIGFGLFIGGGAVVSINLGVGLMLAYLGASIVSVGSTVSTISFTVRHSAYVNAGFNPSGGRRVAAWILTSFTIGTFAGGIGMGVASAGDIGLAIGSICMNGASVIIEIINFMVRQKWDLALQRSAVNSTSSAMVLPVAYAVTNPETGRQTPVFGVAGAF